MNAIESVVRFHCPQCAQPFEADPGQLLVPTGCPNCGRQFLPAALADDADPRAAVFLCKAAALERIDARDRKERADKKLAKDVSAAESAASVSGAIATLLFALATIIAFIVVANGGNALIAGAIFFGALVMSALGHILSRLASIHAALLRSAK
jgi:predicted  nucleic acid-binding Zn-ribbon protein